MPPTTPLTEGHISNEALASLAHAPILDGTPVTPDFSFTRHDGVQITGHPDPTDPGVLLLSDGARMDRTTRFPVGDLTPLLVKPLLVAAQQFGFTISLVREVRQRLPEDEAMEQFLNQKAPTHETAFQLKRNGELYDSFSSISKAMAVVWGAYLHSTGFAPAEGVSFEKVIETASAAERKERSGGTGGGGGTPAPSPEPTISAPNVASTVPVPVSQFVAPSVNFPVGVDVATGQEHLLIPPPILSGNAAVALPAVPNAGNPTVPLAQEPHIDNPDSAALVIESAGPAGAVRRS